MKIYIEKSPRNSNNIFILKRNNWDDYSYKTSYELFYIDSNNNKIDFGIVKIMKESMQSGYVDIPKDEFEYLTQNYCSIGTGQQYYEKIMTLPESTRNYILNSLRDCINNESIYRDFENESAFRNSLLRSISKRDILLYKSILEGNAIPTAFEFEIKIESNEEQIIKVNVNPNSNPPNNVHAIIGSNASGKTQLLSSIVADLTGEKQSSLKIKSKIEFDNDPFEEKSKFAKLVCVIFSPFDSTEPPKLETNYKKSKKDNYIPYEYIGLKHYKKTDKDDYEIEFKTPSMLHNELRTSFKNCIQDSYKGRFKSALKELSSDSIFKSYNLDLVIDLNFDELSTYLSELFKGLSSGHKIVLLSILKLVETVDERTLVLIDEPENYLHPPLLSSYIRAISNLMKNRNAVAFIATHSPIVLQEIPQNCISIIRRNGNIIKIEQPEIETFGENIGILTNQIFNLEIINSGYYNFLNKFVNNNANKDYKNILELLNNHLGNEGKSLLRTLLYEKNK